MEFLTLDYLVWFANLNNWNLRFEFTFHKAIINFSIKLKSLFFQNLSKWTDKEEEKNFC